MISQMQEFNAYHFCITGTSTSAAILHQNAQQQSSLSSYTVTLTIEAIPLKQGSDTR
jgi:hypothetical protein